MWSWLKRKKQVVKDADLVKVNAERIRKGRPMLTRAQASEAIAVRNDSDDDGFDTLGFLIGFSTGVPISPSRGISAGSIAGAILHEPDPAPAARASEQSYSAPEPAPSTPSYESSSSSSYDSSSSSDSGGSSSFSSSD